MSHVEQYTKRQVSAYYCCIPPFRMSQPYHIHIKSLRSILLKSSTYQIEDFHLQTRNIDEHIIH